MRIALRRAGVAAAFAVAALAAVDAGAASQMFKCVEGGRTVYQQQACSASAASDAPASAPRGTAKASAAAEGASAAARKPRPASLAASSVPATPR